MRRLVFSPNLPLAVARRTIHSRYYTTSRDFAFVTADPETVRSIAETFHADFVAATITPPAKNHLVWSPTNATSSLVHLIHSANTLFLLRMRRWQIPRSPPHWRRGGTRCIRAHHHERKSRLNSAFQRLTQAGAEICAYAQTAHLYIHAKIILVSAAEASRRTFLGSENFSVASLTKNREFGILITDGKVLESLANVLASDFAQRRSLESTLGERSAQHGPATLLAAAPFCAPNENNGARRTRIPCLIRTRKVLL